MSTLGVAIFPRASVNLYGLDLYLKLSNRDPPLAEPFYLARPGSLWTTPPLQDPSLLHL